MLGLFFPYDRNQEFLRSFKLISEFKKKISNEINPFLKLRLHPNFSTSRVNGLKKNIYLITNKIRLIMVFFFFFFFFKL